MQTAQRAEGSGWAPRGGWLAGFGGALLLLGVLLLGMLKLEGSWVSQLAGYTTVDGSEAEVRPVVLDQGRVREHLEKLDEVELEALLKSVAAARQTTAKGNQQARVPPNNAAALATEARAPPGPPIPSPAIAATGWTMCAEEGQTCACSGCVRLGLGEHWSASMKGHGTVQCSNAAFPAADPAHVDDPSPGVRKLCSCNPGSHGPWPSTAASTYCSASWQVEHGARTVEIDLKACEARCDADGSCLGISYSVAEGGQCVLCKTSVETTPHSHWESAVKPTATECPDTQPTSQNQLKIHFCGKHFSKVVNTILERDYGYEIDANKDHDWDLVTGGYHHCGTKSHEWDHKTGLVPSINFSKLKPYQNWFPCMGAHETYANKYELCKLIRRADPTACYMLPADRAKLDARMDGKQLFVLKHDQYGKNTHSGRGISYIREQRDIPAAARTEASSYLVQPYRDPVLGPGKFARKAELRIYLAVTSTRPLRLYAYRSMWVVMASHLYDRTKVTGKDAKCMHDTHAQSECKGSMAPNDRMITFEHYVRGVGWSDSQQAAVVREAQRLLFDVIDGANPAIQRDPINVGLHQSGATCFSFLRADFGISAAMQPVLFEINDAPWTGWQAPDIAPIDRQSHTDLFRMLALDQPRAVRATLDRERYERAHLGGWMRLETGAWATNASSLGSL